MNVTRFLSIRGLGPLIYEVAIDVPIRGSSIEKPTLEQFMRRKEKERVIGGGLCIYIGAKQKIQLVSWLALLQCVERQAQHRPDRLKKPRTRSVGTDRLGRFCAENREAARKDIS